MDEIQNINLIHLHSIHKLKPQIRLFARDSVNLTLSYHPEAYVFSRLAYPSRYSYIKCVTLPYRAISPANQIFLDYINKKIYVRVFQ
jgi:hypothetical protein